MGAWGAGNLENDAAADWIADLLDAGTASTVLQTLEAAIDVPGELDADTACEALAAAEVLAAAIGHPHPSHSGQEHLDWAQRNRHLASPANTQLALKALDRITSATSELAALWQAPGGGLEPAWASAVAGLRIRLQST